MKDFKIYEENLMKREDSFCFHCDGCGKCCRKRNDLLLTPFDIFRLRKRLNVDLRHFIDRYCDIYIGSASHFPIVRLKAEEKCCFLRHNMCSVHEVKPAVCALFPLGRTGIYEPNGYSLGYFLQDVSCGDRSEKHTISSWIKNLGEDYEAFCGIRDNLMNDILPFMKSIANEESELQNILQNMVFEIFYNNYDLQQEFLPQFKEHADTLRRFSKDALKILSAD